MHRNRAIITVAAIAHVHVRFTNFVADQVIDLPHLLGQRVAVIRVSRKTLRTDEPSAAAAHRDTHLVAKLILLARLAFCNALDFRLVNRVDLALVVSLLRMDPMRCRE